MRRLWICSEWNRILLVTSFFCDREQRNKIGDDSVPLTCNNLNMLTSNEILPEMDLACRKLIETICHIIMIFKEKV